MKVYTNVRDEKSLQENEILAREIAEKFKQKHDRVEPKPSDGGTAQEKTRTTQKAKETKKAGEKKNKKKV